MKIVLTGGGTAGHVMPNLALVPFLRPAFEIAYVGSEGGLERELVQDLPFFAIPCEKFRRSLSPKNLLIPLRLARSVREAGKVLDRLKPDLVFSKGGYVALPVCLAARKRKIPVFLHESDASLGLANRLCLPFCRNVFTSFPEPAGKKFIHTGAPLRPSLYRGRGAAFLAEYGLTRPLLLIMGGSLGSQALNRAAEAALPQLLQTWNVVHLCGKNQHPAPRKGYLPLPFCDRMPDLYAAADLAVSRAGANAAFELAALGIPTLFVPLPASVSRGDQLKNADRLARQGCALVLRQEDLTPESLLASVSELAKKAPELRENLKKLTRIDGTQEIAEILIVAGKRAAARRARGGAV